MVIRSLLGAALIVACAAPAAAGPAEIDYPRHSLGYGAMMARDYATAERQIRASTEVDANDPARLINLGQALIRTGRYAEGTALLEKARKSDDVELVLGDGRTLWSRDVARRALAIVTVSYAAR